MALSYIGLGSNLGDSAGRVEAALAALAQLGSLRKVSSLYRTEPWGKTDQPDFINAVALLETALAPQALLRALKALETALGRVPSARWGPRAIDLDILTYDDEIIETPELCVPHPRLRERAFVLVPLAQIDPSYEAPRDALAPEERRGVVEVVNRGA